MGAAAQGATTCVTACPDGGGDAGGECGLIGLVGCGGDGAGVCVEACSAWAAWRCESASACGGIGGTWKGSQCEAPCSAASDWEHCPTAEACARGGGTWRGYAVVPPGITGSISVPVSGNGSEVLDWVEEACDAGGYTGAISVACEAVASSRSALAVQSSEGRWMVRGRCERVQGYCRNVLVAPEGVTASSMAAARGMWCRCGSVELPICRRMRGSGWRMGGVISGVY